MKHVGTVTDRSWHIALEDKYSVRLDDRIYADEIWEEYLATKNGVPHFMMHVPKDYNVNRVYSDEVNLADKKLLTARKEKNVWEMIRRGYALS